MLTCVTQIQCAAGISGLVANPRVASPCFCQKPPVVKLLYVCSRQ